MKFLLVLLLGISLAVDASTIVAGVNAIEAADGTDYTAQAEAFAKSRGLTVKKFFAPDASEALKKAKGQYPQYAGPFTVALIGLPDGSYIAYVLEDALKNYAQDSTSDLARGWITKVATAYNY